jgi:hypothetical protein
MDMNKEENQELEPLRIVELIDESGTTMPVEVVVEVEINENLYALFTPANPLIYILCEDLKDEDAPLEQLEPTDFEGISKNIQTALFDYGLKVEIQADEFVLIGEPNESFYEQSELMEVEGDDGVQEYYVLVEVDDATARYSVVMPTEPVIYPGEILSDERARLLTEEEMLGLGSVFEEILAEGFNDDES